eukprot:Nk52_evm21s230 gene=Nk52_evmTU21s230
MVVPEKNTTPEFEGEEGPPSFELNDLDNTVNSADNDAVSVVSGKSDARSAYSETTSIASSFRRYTKKPPALIFIDSIIVLSALLILVISCLSPWIFQQLHSDVSQVSLDSTVMRFENLKIHFPEEDTSTLVVDVFYDNVGNVDVRFKDNRVLATYKQKEFGYLTMPKTKVDRRQPSVINETMQLEVTNHELYQEMATKLFNGEAVVWNLNSGSFKVDYYFLNLFPVEVDLTLSKAVLVDSGKPGKLSMTVNDVSEIEPFKMTLSGLLNSENPSAFAMEGPKDLEFDVFSYGTSVGRIFVPLFNTTQMEAQMESVQFVLSQTVSNQAMVDNIISKWASGLNQTVTMKGPLKSDAKYIINSFESNLLIIGRNTKGLPQYSGSALKANRDGASTLQTLIYNPFGQFNVIMSSSEASMTISRPVAMVLRNGGYPCSSGHNSDLYASDLFFGQAMTSIVTAGNSSEFVMTNQQQATTCDQARPLAACCAMLVTDNQKMSYNISMKGSTRTLVNDVFDMKFTMSRDNFELVCDSTANLLSTCRSYFSNYCFTNKEGELCDGVDPVAPDESDLAYGPLKVKSTDLSTEELNSCIKDGGYDGWGYLTPLDICTTGFPENPDLKPYYCVSPGRSKCAACLIPEKYTGVIPKGTLICPLSVYERITLSPSAFEEAALGRLTTEEAKGTKTSINGLSYSCSNTHDYKKLLDMSFMFYEAQMSGELYISKRFPWKNSSGLLDGGDIDLVGGFYDAGDYVKFNFPMAWSLTMLAWGVLENREAYIKSGNYYYALSTLEWGLSYLVKSYNTNAYKKYGQVQDPKVDHKLWGRIEDYDIPKQETREGYYITEECPGSDLMGESAAAFAAGYMVFQDAAENDGNADYASFASRLKFQAAESIHFAYSYRGRYSKCLEETGGYYSSTNYLDELSWGSLWMYKATKSAKYLESAEKYWKEGLEFPGVAFSWDDKVAGVQLLFSQLTNDDKYVNLAKASVFMWYCNYPGNPEKLGCDLDNFYGNYVPYTPGGFAFQSNDRYGNTRYTMNAAWIAYMLSDFLVSAQRDPELAIKFRKWADSQVNYVLGANPENVSYIVGYGDKYPQFPHHRASSCDLQPSACNGNNYNSTDPNPQVLYGAMVGGPDENDQFLKYGRNDYRANEPALDYNAALTNIVAYKLRQECNAVQI